MGDRYDDDREFYRQQDRAYENYRDDLRYAESRREADREAGWDALRSGDTLGAVRGFAGVEAALRYAELSGQSGATDSGISDTLGYELQSLRFFEHGLGEDPPAELDFNSVFDRSTVRYIGAVPTVVNPWQAIEWDAIIVARYLNPDGSLLLDSDRSGKLDPNWPTFWTHHSCGWDEPGHWPEGLYTVEVWVDHYRLGDRTFLIT